MASAVDMPRALSPSPFDLHLQGVVGHTAVRRFTVSERMSEPYIATIELDALLLGGERIALGTRARLQTPRADGTSRVFHGVVGSVERRGSDVDGAARFRITVEPLFAGLRHTRHRRIFHDQTSVQVAEQILREHRVPHRLRLVEERPVHTHRIQYDESDLAFVERILFEEGIFYFFDHPSEDASDDPDATNLGKTEVLVLCDTAQYYPRAAVDRLVQRTFAAGDVVTGDPATAFDVSRAERTRPQAFFVRGRDPQRPLAPLGDHDDRRSGRRVSVGEGDPVETVWGDKPRLVYESQGTLEDRPPVVPASRQLHDEARADAVEVTGGSLNPTLMPGRVARLEGLDAEPEDVVVVAVEHHGESPRDFGASDAADAGAARTPYRNELIAAPASTTLRPARRGKPRVDGFDAAIVVGPEGEEIHTDEHGRVKVRFFWDLESAGDDKASAWLRVMQPWAGAGFGAQFLPRVGMEVVVAFMGGDVDRPLVAGCVHNGVSPPPFRYPEERTKLGIKSRVTPGPAGDRGWNEISIDDARGSEQVFVRAERNLDEVVLVDHTTNVGRDQALYVTGNRTTKVGGDHAEEVEGNQNRRVVGVRTDTAESDAIETVRGMLGETIEGPATRHIGTAEVPQDGEVFAHGSYLVGADEAVRIRAEKAIVIECGESSIELTPEGIRIRGRDVRTIATEVASMQSGGSSGPSIAATDRIEVAAKEIHLFAESSRLSLLREAELTSDTKTVVTGGGAGLGLAGGATLAGGKVIVAGQGATLVLDAEAKLDGALVKLNCGGEGGGVSAEDRNPKKLSTPRDVATKKVNVRVWDEQLRPLPGKRFAFTVGGEVIPGITNATGEIDIEVPEVAEVGQLTVWKEHPEGERLQWKVNLEPPLPPPHRPPGASIRLSNLGYYQGPPAEELDERLERAIRRFQEDAHLPVTGRLDALTVYELLVMHGD